MYYSLLIYIVLGFFLIMQYVYLFKQNQSVIDKFWSNNGRVSMGNFSKFIFTLSFFIVICCNAYIVLNIGSLEERLIKDSSSKNTTNPMVLSFAILLILGGSLMWAPMFILSNFMITAFLMTLVSVGSLMMTYLSYGHDDILFYCSGYLFFHQFVLNSLIYTGFVPLLKT
jgi:hypothetical protein